MRKLMKKTKGTQQGRTILQPTCYVKKGRTERICAVDKQAAGKGGLLKKVPRNQQGRKQTARWGLNSLVLAVQRDRYWQCDGMHKQVVAGERNAIH